MSKASGRVVVIGGGLAGSEAAWQAGKRGARVRLYEMRPRRKTAAHKTGLLAELVCSNSLKSESVTNASGLLKLELKMLGSLLMKAAGDARVPAGVGVCVDRDGFARRVTDAIEACPNIRVIREEADGVFDDAINVLAPGPLASPAMSRFLEKIVCRENLFFYDAMSPIVDAESIDMSKIYRASRYGKGDSTYVNIPLDREAYMSLLSELREAQVVPKHDFEEVRFFSACMPIEELARKGDETLAHGCMKPVGLTDPRTGRMPYAVVQLRPENLENTLYGMVGFQTRLRYGEQQRIFRMLPGLENARFVRLGSIHRNTYVNAPTVLMPTLEHKELDNVLFAGQITGAEGYVAAAATGLVAGINASRKSCSEECVVPPPETVLGGLVRYVSEPRTGDFQPMNPSFGFVPRVGVRIRTRQRRNLLLSQRSATKLKTWIEEKHIMKDVDEAVRRSGAVS
jgi:methylenetetrahydrofolate--tRNA-(uracil-5-)-methyltransferase